MKSLFNPRGYCASSSLINSISVALLALSVNACQSVNPYYDPQKPHHTATGFKNNYGDAVVKKQGDFFRWQWERRRAGVPKPPQQATPTMPADIAFISANAQPATMQPAITWIGHASMLVQAGGLNVLTDPIFSERASPVQFAGPRRAQPPGLALAQLPPIDVVLISHNHYDHLDTNSVKALADTAQAATLFIVPLGLKAWFKDLGITNVQELDWWQSTTVRGVEFHLTPVQHWSARGVGDRSETLWGGWGVFGPDLHWYYSGDTGYSRDFADTRQHFASRQTAARGGGFDIALIAVGAYEPRWFMKEQHVNPTESVQIHQDLGAKRSVGVHWGTFELTDEPLDQPPKDLATARQAAGVKEEDFFLLAVGQTRKLPVRTQP
jgi:N-acyl-phosphatidylethanolamine-hydrolysing phospholipase D